eukprot:1577378-Pleurochrysis_carterae.AAC.1
MWRDPHLQTRSFCTALLAFSPCLAAARLARTSRQRMHSAVDELDVSLCDTRFEKAEAVYLMPSTWDGIHSAVLGIVVILSSRKCVQLCSPVCVQLFLLPLGSI